MGYGEATEAWVALAIKRVLRYAAEAGLDKVAFVKGKQAAERYQLSNRIKSIMFKLDEKGEFSKKSDTVGQLIAYGEYGQQVLNQSASIDDLPNIVGKGVAERLVERARARREYNERIEKAKRAKNKTETSRLEADRENAAPVTLEGVDLDIGGEGMVTFYDRIVTGVAKNVVKKLGGSLETTKFPDEKAPEPGWRYEKNEDGLYDILDPRGDLVEVSQNEQQARYAVENFSRGLSISVGPPGKRPSIQPSITITPQLREKVLGGLPMFARDQRDQRVPRGQAIAMAEQIRAARKQIAAVRVWRADGRRARAPGRAADRVRAGLRQPDDPR
jgi:hypothetical protein